MSCVVGLIENGRIIMGGDSAGIAGLDIVKRKDPKVFRRGDFLFGACGSFRMLQIVRFKLQIPEVKKEDIFEYFCTDFVEALRTAFKESGFEMKDESGAERGAYFLVGYKNRLFFVEDDFQVGEVFDDFYAIGCGYPYAYGALSILKRLSMSSEDRVKYALEAAEYFSAGVTSPFVIESI